MSPYDSALGMAAILLTLLCASFFAGMAMNRKYHLRPWREATSGAFILAITALVAFIVLKGLWHLPAPLFWIGYFIPVLAMSIFAVFVGCGLRAFVGMLASNWRTSRSG